VNFRLVASLSLAALVIVFIVRNVEPVEVRFLFWTAVLSRSLLLFSLAVGLLTARLRGSRRRHHRGGS